MVTISGECIRVVCLGVGFSANISCALMCAGSFLSEDVLGVDCLSLGSLAEMAGPGGCAGDIYDFAV